MQEGDKTEGIDNHVSLSQATDNVSLKVRFPKSGIYHLVLYAKEEGTEGALPCVFNYVIAVPVQMKDCKPFPKRYNNWGMGCKIKGLDEGEIEEGVDLKVKARVPDAVGVALINGKDWTHLKQVLASLLLIFCKEQYY